MYEGLKIEIVFFANEEIVRTSNEKPWTDGNVDVNGWV